MFAKFFKTFILLILMSLSIFSQKDVRNSNSQKVKSMLADFNNALFFEMNPSNAVKNYVYLDRVDNIDSKYGIDSDFLKITNKFQDDYKLAYYVIDFYGYGAIAMIQLRLGQKAVKKNTEFLDGEMAVDDSIASLYKNALTKSGLSEDELEKLGNVDVSNIDVYDAYMKKLNAGIKKLLNRKLVAKNLKFINKYTKIKKEVFEGPEYYKVEDKIFTYTITFKNGIPKIMKINRI